MIVRVSLCTLMALTALACTQRPRQKWPMSSFSMQLWSPWIQRSRKPARLP